MLRESSIRIWKFISYKIDGENTRSEIIRHVVRVNFYACTDRQVVKFENIYFGSLVPHKLETVLFGIHTVYENSALMLNINVSLSKLYVVRLVLRNRRHTFWRPRKFITQVKQFYCLQSIYD